MWRILVLFVLLPVGIIGGVYWANQQGAFNLENIDIILTKNSNHPRYLRPAVQALDQELEILRGQSLWSLPLEQLNKKISELPWVSELHIVRHWPSRLEVRVVSKEVKFLYLGQGGRLYPVLEDGLMMPAVSIEYVPDVMLLRGDEFVKNRELLMKALEFTKQIPREGSFSQKNISELRYDSKDGFLAQLLKSGVSVKLGEAEVAMKAGRISQVIDYLEARKLDAKMIDANLTKKVLVRLRQEP